MTSGPDFAVPVPPGGYAWWYLDATSDDGQHGLTLIAFVGSVFSPYYFLARARALRRGAPPPAAQLYVAINVALYGPGRRKRWAMTERADRQLTLSRDHYALKHSALEWDGTRLLGTLNERCAPIPRAIRGRFVLHTESLGPMPLLLQAAGEHRWGPIAPSARIELTLEEPSLRWQGPAYFDHNRGAEPLDRGFDYWTWSRRHTPGGTEIYYDYLQRDGEQRLQALHFLRAGGVEPLEPVRRMTLPGTGWRIRRDSRIAGAQIAQTFEDTPFYARNLLRDDRGSPAVSENLDLARFRSAWVQCLLPFRMPRRA